MMLRQMHVGIVQDSRIASRASRPPPKDKSLLSADDRDRVTTGGRLQRFTADWTTSSVDQQSVLEAKWATQPLLAIADAQLHAEHCSIDFATFDKKVIEKRANLPRAQPEARGLFRETAA